ncbi:NAD-dependent epimerase/dehydratase family protein [Nocardioides sp. zg-536]|uniref:NAD-dependent epimerase/dehydratase family protein n=1 Tax=Nocardioides faecalis TaxID=2803858 RepID=A0A938Y6C4_9ACTN|nr:NAD-dependent epimerase/dehydratase family protein [Nocardioides faecalis]MBM9460034.1 NAD-dependent epimerase/dehydratase family protein [Nocardioides faecalis]MBS4753098.1 NAD-dependent epimerase/dehydratase family protein [Nocardioides faecalis]QVI58746.1 NAD-dependent epimerase/dehydratase family protein [Nocardioides faecalis]
MRILVLGGNRFLSRAVAAEAVAAGHEVICVNRGRSGTVPTGVEHLRWDRDEPAPADLVQRLADRPPDAVVDVARRPSHVRRALDAVPPAHWVFVSTISVYADDADAGGPGVGTLLEPVVDDLDPMSSPEAYGAMKVACEQLVHEAVPGAVVLRPGLIVGPGDPSGRFAYWAWRSAHDGEVLAPGRPEDLVQVVDVRDLATWIVALAERGPVTTPVAESGDPGEPGTPTVYDAVGPVTTFGDLFAAALPDARPVWVDHDFLLAEGVASWAGPRGIPLWLPRPSYDGMMSHDAAPATAAGLVSRPLADTVRDTRAWLAADPAARIDGITAEREAELLRRWRVQEGGSPEPPVALSRLAAPRPPAPR